METDAMETDADVVLETVSLNSVVVGKGTYALEGFNKDQVLDGDCMFPIAHED